MGLEPENDRKISDEIGAKAVGTTGSEAPRAMLKSLLPRSAVEDYRGLQSPPKAVLAPAVTDRNPPSVLFTHQASSQQAITKILDGHSLEDAIIMVELAREQRRPEVRRNFRTEVRSIIGDFDDQKLAAISHGLIAHYVMTKLPLVANSKDDGASIHNLKVVGRGIGAVFQCVVVVGYDFVKWISQNTTTPSNDSYFNSPNTSKASWESISAGIYGTFNGVLSQKRSIDSDPRMIAQWQARGLLPKK